VRVTVTRTGDLNVQAAAIERSMRAAARTAGRDVAKVARKAILDDVRSARGTLSMMTGRLGITTKVDARPVGAIVTLTATPAGMWAIVEYGTKAYTEKPRRAKVLAVGHGDVVGMTAHHPRRAGHRYWEGAEGALIAAVDPAVTEPFDQVFT
jgi:hypothetical protein